MGDQTTFAGLAWTTKKKVTRRERFLAEMGAVIPWERFLQRIEPYYPKQGAGRWPLGMEKMLRIYFLQHWFDLSDPGAEDALYDSESMRRFVGIELGEDVVPDESTILNFRHLLEEHSLTEGLFQEVKGVLEERGVWIKSGTIVDATIIAAPTSTKNQERKRDPEMRSTQKGTTWYFGMKVHVGTDKQGLVHSLSVTDAATPDLREMGSLLHGEECEIYGDKAYSSQELRQQCDALGIRYRVNRRGHRKKELNESLKRKNRKRSRIRARGEYPFLVVKHLWGFRKVRYRGLAKNETRAYAAFALANLYLARKQLQTPRAKCRR